MQKWILVLLCSLPVLLFSQITWVGPKPVSTGKAPDLAIDPNSGELHVAAIYQGVIYTKLDPDGEQILQETVPNSTVDLGNFGFGPTIAVDQAGHPHICYRKPTPDNLYYSIYYTKKSDAGWSAPLEIDSNISRGYVVRMAIDRNNVVHIVRGESSDPGTVLGTFAYFQVQGSLIRKKQTFIGDFRADNKLEIDVDPSGGVHVIVGNPNPEHGPIDYYNSAGGFNNLAKVEDIHHFNAYNRNGAPDVFVDMNSTVHFCYGTRKDSDLNDNGSIRYARYKDGIKNQDLAVTPGSGTGSLLPWKDAPVYNGWGLSSLASSSEGQFVVVSYILKDKGPLYTVHSEDGGDTWSAPQYRAPAWDSFDGRNLHVIRGYQNNMYLVYQTSTPTIRLQYLRNIGDALPVASAGGDYFALEGGTVTFDASASADSGMNAGIVRYEWDFDNDGIYDLYTGLETIQRTYDDDYSGQVRMRVTDLSGNQVEDVANVQVDNVAPIIETGQDLAILEGGRVNLACTVQDPGNDQHVFMWDFGDGQSSPGQAVSHDYPDNGLFTVIVSGQDDDGGEDADTLTVTVENIPPTAEAGGPYSASRNQPIYFVGSGQDAGVLDVLSYGWDLDGNGDYEISGTEVSKSWADTGHYTVYFRVQDDDGGTAVDSALVTIRGDKPTLLAIPDQITQEGGVFLPLNLDNYITHPSQNVQDMLWWVGDTVLFSASITNRQLHVSFTGTDWFGEETLTLTVQDLGGFRDSTWVTYRVENVNDDPFWSQNPPNFAFDEDGQSKFKLKNLLPLVQDIDNVKSDFFFTVTDGEFVNVTVDTVLQEVTLSSAENWHGNETIQLTVFDGAGGSATALSRVTVRPMPDAPYPFDVIEPEYMRFVVWPDTLRFRWHTTGDPDGDPIATYIWQLAPIEVPGNPATLTRTLLDTVYEFVPDPSVLPDGVWAWSAIARDASGLETPCTEPGYFRKDLDPNTRVSGVEEKPRHLALHQNYPNPFNPETVIQFDLPQSMNVELVIYNSLGQQVIRLESGMKKAGVHRIWWNATDRLGNKVPSGIYVYRLQTESRILFRKLMLLQ